MPQGSFICSAECLQSHTASVKQEDNKNSSGESCDICIDATVLNASASLCAEKAAGAIQCTGSNDQPSGSVYMGMCRYTCDIRQSGNATMAQYAYQNVRQTVADESGANAPGAVGMSHADLVAGGKAAQGFSAFEKKQAKLAAADKLEAQTASANASETAAQTPTPTPAPQSVPSGWQGQVQKYIQEVPTWGWGAGLVGFVVLAILMHAIMGGHRRYDDYDDRGGGQDRGDGYDQGYQRG